jgi:hypothetical protein
MGVVEPYTDTDCEVLPDFEKEGLDSNDQKSIRNSSLNDEYLSAHGKTAILESSVEVNQQATPEVAKVLEELGLRLVEDGFVKWRTDASAHPRNWSASRKAFDTGLVLMLDLFTTAVSTAGPPVAEVAKFEYGLSRVVALVAFGSM